MTDIRTVFGTATVDVSAWLTEQQPVLQERFNGPSALAEFSLRGLAGHLLRAMTTVEAYLDQPAPAAGPGVETLSAAGYFVSVLTADTDLDSDFNRAIRQRAMESAPERPEDFAIDWADTAARLTSRLEQEPGGRLVSVYGGHVLTLDDYLVTRLVELSVHADDLAASLDAPPPPLAPAATALVIATLVEVARLRHGDFGVLRALTRRERDAADALRVL